MTLKGADSDSGVVWGSIEKVNKKYVMLFPWGTREENKKLVCRLPTYILQYFTD